MDSTKPFNRTLPSDSDWDSENEDELIDYNLSLLSAAQWGDRDVNYIIRALENGADINTRGSGNNTSLMFAIQNGYSEVVNCLIERGADIHLQNDEGNTALMIAVKREYEAKDVGMVSAFISFLKEEDYLKALYAKNNENLTPLTLAAQNLHSETVKTLTSAHQVKDLLTLHSQTDEDGNTALMIAASNGKLDMVTELILSLYRTVCKVVNEIQHEAVGEKAGKAAIWSILNIQNNVGETTLMIAAKHGFTDIVHYLINYIDVQDRLDKAKLHIVYALVIAAEHRKSAVVSILAGCLNDKIVLNALNQNFENLLMIAARQGDFFAIIYLLSKFKSSPFLKPALETVDYSGNTVLMLAALSGCAHTIAILATHFAFDATIVNAKNNAGNTALMIAAEQDHFKTANVLIAIHGINANEKNTLTGQTALMIAASLDHYRTVDVFLSHREAVDLNATDNNGNTALMLAAEKGYFRSADALIHVGADVNLKNRKGDTALTLSQNNENSRVTKALVNAPNFKSEEETSAPTLEFKALSLSEEKLPPPLQTVIFSRKKDQPLNPFSITGHSKKVRRDRRPKKK